MKKICFSLAVLFFSVFLFAQSNRGGTISQIKSGEIIVRNENPDSPFQMGEKLRLLSGDRNVVLEVTFPMQTSARCKIISGSFSRLKIGAIVYSGGALKTSGKGDSPDETVKQDDQKKRYGLPAVLTDSEVKGTIRFCWWGGDARHRPTLEVMELFASKYPGTEVKGEYMGWGGYQERLTTQITAGIEADVIQINWAWISAMFSKNGTGFFDLFCARNIINLSSFGNAIDSGVVNGKLNAIPVSMSARLFLWQKTTWDKAGISIPRTWDDLFAAGASFEQTLGKGYHPIDGNLYDVILMAHAYMLQKTGRQWIDPKKSDISYTRQDALDFIQVFRRLTETRAAVSFQERLSSAGPEAPTEQQKEWVLGKWAGNYTWDSTFRTRMSSLPKTTMVTVGDFLTMKGAKSSGLFGRPSLMFAVSRNTRNPVLAAKFIEFMLNDPEAITILRDSRGIPASSIAYNQMLQAGAVSSIDKKAYETIRTSGLDMPSPYFEHMKIQELIRDICEKVSLGKLTDEQAADRMTAEANDILTVIRQ
jgi:oligogalacturonide transport system substrate-binding protein